jgi:Antitoxin Xre/MbcA/ParS C-terminal toxin-binding domain
MPMMEFLSNRGAVDHGAVISPATFTAENRRRLSGPGLRTFLNIAALWQLSERERLLVMGSPARSTYHNWVSRAQAGAQISLPLDTLVRISAILGIHKGLQTLFDDPQRGVQWLRTENAAPLFGSQRPMDLIHSGTQMGILDVRRFLDGWRGGVFAAPTDHEIEDQPWRDDDIRIVDG